MKVNGSEIAAEILDAVAANVFYIGRTPRLCAITCAPNFETKKYLSIKKRQAAAVGIALNVIELPADADTSALLDCLEKVVDDADGVVVQLPLPPHIDRDAVLAAVPVEKDPDGFAYGKVPAAVMSPVVAAIDEISKKHQVEWSGAQVVVLGQGRLVGVPAAQYAKEKGAKVTTLTKETYDPDQLATADIIISGIGVPATITSALVKPGVIIFDAGTSEDGGELVGDAAPDVAKKAALITPVPGGIGPITIACLLRNLVFLTRQ